MRQVKIGKVLLTYGGEWTASKGYPVLTYVLHDGDGWWNVTPCVNSEPKDNNPVWVRATNVSALRTAVQTLITNGQQLEAAMEAAEAIRVSAESARVSAESARVSAENARVSAENARVSAENVRVSAENGRNNAESGRVNAETLRVSAENARVSAETARETASAQAVTNANTATAAANSAASGANTAAGNANTAATGAGNVNATISGTTLTVTDRTGSSTSVDTKGEKGDKGDKGDTGGTFADAPSDSKVYGRKNGTWVESVDESLASRVSSLESSKADKNGHYEGMSVAMAENLIGKGNATEQTFTERVAGGGASIEDGVAEYRKVKGGSVVWNQLAKTNINNSSYTFNNVENKINISSKVSDFNDGSFAVFKLNANHYYYIKTTSSSDKFRLGNYYSSGLNINANNGIIYTYSIDWDIVLGYKDDIDLGEYDLNVCVVDLTKWYNGNVPSGLTADKFLELNPQVLTMSYNEGEIVNFTAKKVVTTGRNLWNGLGEEGKYINSNGTTSNSDSWFATDYVEIVGGKSYYINFDDDTSACIAWYDGNKNFISANNISGRTYSSPTNSAYARISVPITHKDSFIFNISDINYNGQYEPYETHELNVDPSTIKDADGNQLFPHGLCSNGSVYDEITKDGATKRISNTIGANGLYAVLATPISVTFADERQTDVEVFANGTEKIVVAEGSKSAPICADVNYGIDYVGTIDRLHDDVGKASDLTTTAKNNLVSAINELVARISALETTNTNEGGAE